MEIQNEQHPPAFSFQTGNQRKPFGLTSARQASITAEALILKHNLTYGIEMGGKIEMET